VIAATFVIAVTTAETIRFVPGKFDTDRLRRAFSRAAVCDRTEAAVDRGIADGVEVRIRAILLTFAGIADLRGAAGTDQQ